MAGQVANGLGGENMEREQTTIRLPSVNTKNITVRMHTDLYRELKSISAQMGLTITSVLIVAIWRSVLGPKY